MDKRSAYKVLFITAALIMLLGILFTIFGIVYQTSFGLVGSRIPSYVIGLVVLFLGFRYMKSLFKLKKRIDPDSQFSWKNFSKPMKGFLKKNV
ncbi:MAG: hypothetical protein Q8920_01930 [Bacillota bacterium]|nr:hypothetical protein [Bacillota bacterium]